MFVKINLFKKLKSIIYRNKKQDIKNVKIYPLSPQNNLSTDSNYCVYKEFLLAAFQEKRVHNIAITGNFGIGKSSILHTFCKNEKKKFIYLSVAEFSRQENEYDQKRFECILLKQLIAQCHKQDIPLSRFQMVCESKSKRTRIILSVFAAFYSWSVFLLVFFSKILGFLQLIWKDCSFQELYFSLYAIVITSSAIFLGLGLYQILMHTKIKEISANINESNAQFGMTAECVESCLEQYSFELIYIIESLSKKYDAIVFEDMDRLPFEICINIFIHLREINYNVNKRMTNKNCRFLFVVNDDLMSKLNHTKFFDYIMPIIPELGIENAEKIMQEILIDIGIEWKDSKIFLDLSKKTSELNDYRMLNQIRNEYYIFEQREKNNLANSDRFGVVKKDLDSMEKARLFAFVIYKVILPEDYYLIREMKSAFFPVIDIEKIRREIKILPNYRIAWKLKNAGFLGIGCMRYIGYSQKERLQLYRKLLSSNDVALKRDILKNDDEFLCGIIYESDENERINYMKGVEDSFMWYFISSIKTNDEIVKKFLMYIECNNKYTNVEKRLLEAFKDKDSSVGTIILEYFVKRGYKDFNWLSTLLDTESQLDKFLQSIEDLEDNSRRYIVGHVKSVLVKNASKIRQYPRLTIDVEDVL